MLILPLPRHLLDDMNPDFVITARDLARKWTGGFRDGPDQRPAWKHPEDVVALVRQVPGLEPLPEAEAMAWSHDLIEDGRKPDGTPVTVGDLRAAGLPESVVLGVVVLTRVQGVSRDEYTRRVGMAPEVVRVVKCCDRIANLLEGSVTFKSGRWSRYVTDTRQHVLPLLRGIRGPWSSWLKDHLDRALLLRPV